jgi:PleD family two-component response regulator
MDTPDLDEPVVGRVIDLADRRTRPVSVLLVAKDLPFATIVRDALVAAERPFQVEIAVSLSSALACLSRGEIDLVLADLELADIRGAAAVQFLKRAAPGVPIVALSGSDDLELALGAVRAGAEECVNKNAFSAQSLVWLIVLVLERHRRLTADLVDSSVDPLTGLATGSALEVFGRYLVRLTDRTGLQLAVMYLQLKAAPNGRWADWEALLIEVSGALARTLRRCDVLSRIGPMELAVALVSERGDPICAVPRVRKALLEVGAAPYVRMGVALHRPGDARTLDELLDSARAHADPVPV